MNLRTINQLVTLLSIFAVFTLTSCAANIAQAPNMSDTDSSKASYIWHVGFAPVGIFDYDDIGVLSTIKGDNFELHVKGDSGTAVPAGQYELTVAYLENAICLSDIIADGVYYSMTGSTASVGSSCKEAVEIFDLSLMVEEGHLYIPFADDECDQNWAWIEDWGSAKENGAPSFRYLKGIRQTSGKNPMTGETTVVAGNKPPETCP